MISFLSSILKDVSLATLANLLGRAANILIPLMVIASCGANAQTDLFFFIFALAFFCYGNLANAISETTVPLLLSGRLKLSRPSVAYVSLLWSGLVLFAGIIWTAYHKPTSWYYAPALALMAGSGLLNGFATGAHYAQERYVLPGITWALRMVPLVLFMLSRQPTERLPLLALGIGGMDCMRAAILVFSARIRPRSDQSTSASDPLSTCFSAYSAVILAMLIMGLNPIVDRLIASLSGPGGISILETGERVYGVLAGMCGTGMMTVLLTRLSKDAVQGDLERQWRSVAKLTGAWSAVWMVFGAGAGYFALGWWLEAFTALIPAQFQAVENVYWLYLIGLPALIMSLAYIKHLQARQKFWALVVISSLAVLANIPLSLALRNLMGIPGIALATTLVYVLTCVILMLAAHCFDRRKQP